MHKEIEFILYVSDQERSSKFYQLTLGKEPRLNVPGMTEFELSEGCILGLMPENGIAKLLTGMKHPAEGSQIPRCELYILTSDARELEENALSAGGKLVNPYSKRDWGHSVTYVADPDGHILAFADNNE
jgi:predicted enzyme related to lactoylglutathione lyase